MTDAQHQPDPDHQLQRDLYYLVAAILRAMLPAPVEDTPEALARRDRVAIAKVASMVPANPAEARLAAHHVAAMARAADALRQAVQHAADPKRVAQFRAQAARMGREARGYLDSLLRMQASPEQREATGTTRDSAALAEHCVLGLMTDALASMPPTPATPPEASAAPPQVAPILDYDDRPEEAKRLHRLQAKASRYAILHAERVKLIRKLGRLPDICDFEPPEPELLHEIITGTHPNLCWADTYEPHVGAKA